jgi:hypothetical protein
VDDVGEPWYATREQIKQAMDSADTARDNTRVDRAAASASRDIDTLCHRIFWPRVATRTFDWPRAEQLGAPSWVLWLDGQDLLSATTVTSGGTAISTGAVLLRPDTGPPYTRVELDLSEDVSFGGGDTWQRDITITGLWGYRNTEVPGGALAEALDTTETSVDVTTSAAVGVGSLIRVGSERMIVTGKGMLTTGQTGTLTADDSARTLAVSDGTAFAVGETLLLDAERVLIEDIAANNLIVQRAYDGSTLAAHTAATIYAPRTLTVERGAGDTTAAAHDTAAAVSVWEPPPLVHDLALALAVTTMLQQRAGYARVVGTGDQQRETTGRGVAELRKRVRAAHGRYRHRAV